VSKENDNFLSTVGISVGIYDDAVEGLTVMLNLSENGYKTTYLTMTAARARLYGEMLISCADAIYEEKENGAFAQ
jgi:hypothetical protein